MHIGFKSWLFSLFKGIAAAAAWFSTPFWYVFCFVRQYFSFSLRTEEAIEAHRFSSFSYFSFFCFVFFCFFFFNRVVVSGLGLNHRFDVLYMLQLSVFKCRMDGTFWSFLKHSNILKIWTRLKCSIVQTSEFRKYRAILSSHRSFYPILSIGGKTKSMRGNI